jgi:hypothetical protein
MGYIRLDVDAHKQILGVEHPDTLMSMNNLAVTYSNQGRNVEAAALKEEVLEKRKQILGVEHPDTPPVRPFPPWR